jgi:hypothetical protein
LPSALPLEASPPRRPTTTTFHSDCQTKRSIQSGRSLRASCSSAEAGTTSSRTGTPGFGPSSSALGPFIMEPYRPAVTARQESTSSERGGIRHCSLVIPL